ncbi:unnamed protein product [Bemisia tabaci]|uniref:Follicle cell protein 3C-1 n=1 Tax=Bemisia tabaci TaxID=7038 RepID=A0A9P0A4N2_BEMTA|nr:unnamed protein product [Bemisia tabaci]
MRSFLLLSLLGLLAFSMADDDYEVPEDMVEEAEGAAEESEEAAASVANEVGPKPEAPTSPTFGGLGAFGALGLGGGNCDCGVFLTGSFTKGSSKQPTENPALEHECPEETACNAIGLKQCTNKCLDVLVKHLPNSPTIICGAIDREVYKERAYLWVKHCNTTHWTNTNLSAGREYCCKDNAPYKCPVV